MKISKGTIIRTSITLDKEVAEIGKRNAEKRGFGHSFSAYVSWLIIRDSRGAVLREDIAETRNAPLYSEIIEPPSSNLPSTLLDEAPPHPSLISRDPFDN